MAGIEKISIALPPEMAALVRAAVSTGEYASSSEVVRDALRNWSRDRAAQQEGTAMLRRMWQQATQDKGHAVAPKDVLERLGRKYAVRPVVARKAR